MNVGQNYAQKRAYVEVLLSGVMDVKRDFAYIKYARTKLTDQEYIRIGDKRGTSVTLNVTALGLEDIMNVVCDYIVNGPVGKTVIRYIVHEDRELLGVADLFKGVA